MKDQEIADPTVQQLKVLVRLTSMQLTAGMATVDAIRVLDLAGVDRGVIADVCGTTRNAVGARLSEVKKGTARKRKSTTRGRGS